MLISARKFITGLVVVVASLGGVFASAAPSQAVSRFEGRPAAVLPAAHVVVAAQAATPRTAVPTVAGAHFSQLVATCCGFKVQLWHYTIADPWALYRQYYYNKCNPKKNVREFRFSTGWVYTTYECWAILA